MRRFVGGVLACSLLLTIAIFAQGSHPAHPDYVPDEKTARRIAEAVLIGQYGEERVKAQLPLLVESRGRDRWVLQGRVVDKEGHIPVGGGFGVLLNRHDGCVLEMVENMK